MPSRPMYVICKDQNHRRCCGRILLVTAIRGTQGAWHGQCPHCMGGLRLASRSERVAYREWLNTQSKIEEARK